MRLYLLIKLFAATGLPAQALPKVTVETAAAGSLVVAQGGERQVIHIPEFLRLEPLGFAGHVGRTTGPLFVTRAGAPLGRTNVSNAIRRFCVEAQAPRCLRRLYQTTRSGIEATVNLLVEQAHKQLMEIEQLSIGWEMDI